MREEPQKRGVRITEKGIAIFRELQKYPESERPRILNEILRKEAERQRIAREVEKP